MTMTMIGPVTASFVCVMVVIQIMLWAGCVLGHDLKDFEPVPRRGDVGAHPPSMPGGNWPLALAALASVLTSALYVLGPSGRSEEFPGNWLIAAFGLYCTAWVSGHARLWELRIPPEPVRLHMAGHVVVSMMLGCRQEGLRIAGHGDDTGSWHEATVPDPATERQLRDMLSISLAGMAVTCSQWRDRNPRECRDCTEGDRAEARKIAIRLQAADPSGPVTDEIVNIQWEHTRYLCEGHMDCILRMSDLLYRHREWDGRHVEKMLARAARDTGDWQVTDVMRRLGAA